jgi:hypothetical protein
MVRMLVGLSVFFLLASAADLAFLHVQVLQEHNFDVTAAFVHLTPTAETSHQQLLDEARLRAIILLESNTIERHYHQASALVLSRLWKDYLGFVTGMILSLVGAAFVLGKLNAPRSEMSGKTPVGEVTLKTASPGLVLTVLGVALMITTLVTHSEISVRNASVYLHDTPGDTSRTAGLPPPHLPQLPPPK